MRRLLILLIFSVSLTSWGQTIDSHFLQDSDLDTVKAQLEKFPKNGQIAIALIKGDSVEYHGLIQTENGFEPIENQNSIFEIGSVTKTFTTTLLCQYIQKGILTAEDKINEHLPFKIKRKITFEQLANHTSGLARLPDKFMEVVTDQANPYVNYTNEIFENCLKNDLIFKNKAGKSSDYSNIGTALLAYTLEQTGGQAYSQQVEGKILKKFGMTNSGFNLDDLDKEQLVVGLNGAGYETANWEWNSAFCGAGGLKSTAEDMVKYVRAYFNPENEALQIGLKRTFIINEKMEMGLGWHILTRVMNDPVYWHNGRTGGYTSSVVMNTTAQTGVVLLSNQTKVSIDVLAIYLLKRL